MKFIMITNVEKYDAARLLCTAAYGVKEQPCQTQRDPHNHSLTKPTEPPR
jgi:hypothetical protein